MAPAAIIACAPMRQNWCTPVKPPIVTQSPIVTWPASCALLENVVSLPTTQSCAMWT
jgi:hypothetical protein